MDNAQPHYNKLLKPLFSKINLFYSAPYSPILNPIEEFFGYLKNKIRYIPKKKQKLVTQSSSPINDLYNRKSNFRFLEKSFKLLT